MILMRMEGNERGERKETRGRSEKREKVKSSITDFIFFQPPIICLNGRCSFLFASEKYMYSES